MTDEVFKANFNENDSETSDIDDLNDYSNGSDFLHNNSVERVKIFIEIAELSLRNGTSFSLSTMPSKELTLRHYNYEIIATTWGAGIKVKCFGRGIDGVSAYGYHGSNNCSGYNYFGSKYFHSSGSYTFWRKTKCLRVNVIGFHNFNVSFR